MRRLRRVMTGLGVAIVALWTVSFLVGMRLVLPTGNGVRAGVYFADAYGLQTDGLGIGLVHRYASWRTPFEPGHPEASLRWLPDSPGLGDRTWGERFGFRLTGMIACGPGGSSSRLVRYVPWYALALPTLPFALATGVARWRSRARLTGTCASCGYDLRGAPVPGKACPECGAA